MVVTELGIVRLVKPLLENNTKVLTQWKVLDSTIYKRRRCYSKEIKG